MNLNNLNIKNYIQDKLNEIVTDLYPDYKIKVYDELNFDYEEDEKLIIVIYKQLAGNVDSKTISIPAQLTIFSENNSLQVTKDIFNKFVSLYSNTNDFIDDYQFKQTYSTIVDVSNFMEVNNGYRSMLYVGANFTILENTSDLKELYIDNEKIEYVDYNLSYVISPSASSTNKDKILKNKKQTATLSLNVTIQANQTIFMQKLRALRLEQLNGNNVFEVKLVYFDNNAEEVYKMIIGSAALIGSKAALGVYSIQFLLTK